MSKSFITVQSTEQRSTMGLQWSSKSWSFKTAITNSHQLGIFACLRSKKYKESKFDDFHDDLGNEMIYHKIMIPSCFKILSFSPALSTLWSAVQWTKPFGKDKNKNTVSKIKVCLYVLVIWSTWSIPGVSSSAQLPCHTSCSSNHCTCKKV